MTLVTIITPITESRKKFIPNLERMVAAQTYPHIEHVYVWEDGTIGHKRNIGCEIAKGDIIIHFDSDDHYAPDWVARCVECLQRTGADICGLEDIWFYDVVNRHAWFYTYGDPFPPFIAGATMAYTKAYWQRARFDDEQVGEDAAFVRNHVCKIEKLNYPDGFVALIHEDTTAPKRFRVTRHWKKHDEQDVLKVLEGINC